MLDTSIKVKTENFDGPLGLLLHLIQREEMDIRKLDLSVVTKQYLGYLAQMRELDFDVAGDYLYLAATLILLKSKACLSEEEKNQLEQGGNDLAITSRSELIRRLEELQKFQALGKVLWARPKKGHEIFTRPKVDRKEILNSILTPMSLEQLIGSMIDLMQKNKRRYTMIRRDRISIKEKLEVLKTFLKKGMKVEFDEIVKQGGDAQEIGNIVISFISVLELARLKKLSIFQNEEGGNIYLDVLDSLENFNVDMADGFEDENSEEEALPDDVVTVGTAPSLETTQGLEQ